MQYFNERSQLYNTCAGVGWLFAITVEHHLGTILIIVIVASVDVLDFIIYFIMIYGFGFGFLFTTI